MSSAWFLSAPALALMTVTAGVFFMRAANALINPPTQIRIMSHFNHDSAQALGLNMCLGFTLSSCAISLVTLFAHRPLTGLILVSSFFSLLAGAIYHLNRKILY